ncbi:Cof-type HAD-IIB family hydrolase [Calidifontibacillus oryziterrae]|uniref:Cof-type HAD-IIB family hydrolase n=1 Tax=Calidifontibacillus oryziterrae TaxID=1191699 RepID=UPI00031D0C97|nr:Cof-type HAD-IIB family hydrolase [Calidifontibacillus oryziterrae]
MKPHLIAVDLDGTLLKDDKTISKRTLNSIKKVRDLGHHVMIATGRPFRASNIYYKQLALDTPIVNYNGAYVHHPMDNKWKIFHSTIDLQVAKKIIDTCNKHNIKNIMAQVKDNVFLQSYDETIMEFISFGNPTIETGHIKEKLKDKPTSILIHTSDENVDHIREQLTMEVGNYIDHRKSGGPWNVIEIIKTGINKAVGLKKVADYYNIPTERIIAFGDEDNDLEMLHFANYGIAMGNAIDKVKSIANDVTETNEKDGIAHYLEQFFKL